MPTMLTWMSRIVEAKSGNGWSNGRSSEATCGMCREPEGGGKVCRCRVELSFWWSAEC